VVARDASAPAADRLAAAERSFALVRRRFQEGLAAPIEFLDARTALTSAELNRVLTVNRFAVRWVELERAAALRDVANTEKAPWN
jgi:outer membrane protein TolC